MKTRNILLSVTVLIFIFFGLFYVLFDQYVTSASNEAVLAWIKTEENSIIEGNLLSSMTKTQKTLLSSEFIKGLAVVDQTDSNLRPLIEFGQRIDFSKIQLNHDRIQSTGLFKKYLQLDLPNSPNLKVVFSIYSEKIMALFWITGTFFCFLTLIFGLIIYQIKKTEQKIIEKYAQKAKQAAHDLAQPIVVLNSLVHSLTDSSHDVIKSVILRINNIVDDLSDKKSVPVNHNVKPEPILNTSLLLKIENLIQEKQLTAPSQVKINLDAARNLSDVAFDQYSLIRVLANFLQNSIEANALNIKVTVYEVDNDIQFTVSDDGVGISDDILNRLGEKGFTHGKEFGSGLGLFGAYQFAEENSGQIRINSNINQGCEIILSVPKKNQQKIILATDTKLFILDDEDLILRTWKLKLQDLELDQPVEYFKSSLELSERIKNFDPNMIFIFSDYNLSDKLTGLDFIETQGLQGQAALITGQHDDPEIIKRSQRLKVPVISKIELHNLQIELI
jgi:signal transduction histidine kinase